jgi:hypothetical protein
MNSQEILSRRLHNTGLSTAPFHTAEDAVTHLGAVQAQDFAAAKWSLGLRIRNSTDAEIEQAFNDGRIQRIHILRPTWHFVMPEEIRWMTDLTAPRVRSILAGSNRRIGLDDAVFAKTGPAIARALEGRNYLTRQELKAVLADIGIGTDVQRLSHILMQAELDGLICSGPRRGKQFTYALLDERVRKSARINREQALETLALRYFTSHGPAQLKDFSWWSGLSGEDARAALDRIESGLEKATVKGKTFWFSPTSGIIPDPPPARLLSIYDEYTISYRDRSDISESRDIERMIARGNALTAVIVIDGKVAGTWRKTTKKDSVEIRVSPFRKLDTDQQEAVEAEVARYGKFVGMPAVVV